MTEASCRNCRQFQVPEGREPESVAESEAACGKGHDLPEGLAACPDYVMTDAFQEWILGAMRKEVEGQANFIGAVGSALQGKPQDEEE